MPLVQLATDIDGLVERAAEVCQAVSRALREACPLEACHPHITVVLARVACATIGGAAAAVVGEIKLIPEQEAHMVGGRDGARSAFLRATAGALQAFGVDPAAFVCGCGEYSLLVGKRGVHRMHSDGSARLRLDEEDLGNQEWSKAASLKHQLQAIELALAHVPEAPDEQHLNVEEEELAAEVLREREHCEELVRSRSRLVEEASEASTTSDRLRSELQNVSVHFRSADSEIAQLKAKAATAEQSAKQACTELDEVLRLKLGLEEQHAQAMRDASEESVLAASARQKLEQKGWGLTFLRSTARSHVNDLQGNVTSLDQQIRSSLTRARLVE